MVTTGDVELGSSPNGEIKIDVINRSAQKDERDAAAAAQDLRQRRIGLVSLALQMLASLCWAVGASLAGPSSLADYLQLGAALFWCVSNGVASLAYIGQVQEAQQGTEQGKAGP